MREIKFRGYNIDKGWLYGSLIQKHKPTEVENVYWCSLIHNGALDAELVVTESVGQFTGLKDKNGKEIYEGDILTGGVGFGQGINPKAHYHVVKWDVQQTWHGMADGHKSKSIGFTFEYYYFTENGCQVIGNIYENPELL